MLRIGRFWFEPDFVVFALFYLSLFQMDESQIIAYSRFALLLLWCFFVIIKGIGNHRVSVSKKAVALIAFLICTLIRSIICYQSLKTAIGNSLATLALFSGFLFFDYYNGRLQKGEKKIVVYGMLSVWFLYCFRALRFYKEHPNAARTIISHGADYSTNGIADPYAIAYGSVLIAIVLFGILICGRKSLTRTESLGILLYIALLVVLIWSTQSTITLLAMILGLILILVQVDDGGKHTTTKRTLGIIIMAIICLVLILGRYRIGLWLVSRFEGQGNIFSDKLSVIGNTLIAGSVQGDLRGRIGFYLLSWKRFQEHPLWGIEIFGSSSGGHSEVLDALAKYGILLGTIPYFALFYYSLRKIKAFLYRRTYVSFLLSFTILVCFNPFHSYLSNFALMLVVPLIGSAWSERERPIEGAI